MLRQQLQEAQEKLRHFEQHATVSALPSFSDVDI
jgi:hypothetical protein